MIVPDSFICLISNMSALFSHPDLVCTSSKCVNNVRSCSKEICDSCESKCNQLNIICAIRPFVKEYLIPQINDDIIIERSNILHYENNLSDMTCEIEKIKKCIKRKQLLLKHIIWCISSKMIEHAGSRERIISHLQSIHQKIILCMHHRDVHSFHWNECYNTKDVDKIQMHTDLVKREEQAINQLIKEIECRVCSFYSMKKTQQSIDEVRDSIKHYHELLSFHIYQYYQVTDIDQKRVHEQNIFLQEQNIKRANQEIEDLILSFFLTT